MKADTLEAARDRFKVMFEERQQVIVARLKAKLREQADALAVRAEKAPADEAESLRDAAAKLAKEAADPSSPVKFEDGAIYKATEEPTRLQTGMLPRDTFETAIAALWALIRRAADQARGTARFLSFNVHGHEGKGKPFDDEALEVMEEFIPWCCEKGFLQRAFCANGKLALSKVDRVDDVPVVPPYFRKPRLPVSGGTLIA